MYFDTHAHVDTEKFDFDRETVIENPALRYILNPGYDLESSLRAVRLAQRFEKVYAAVGVHPHDAGSMDDEMLEMIEHLSHSPKVVAIGEIGLDYYRNLSPAEVQELWFRRQIRLAKKRNLPIIIHDRDANQRVFDVLSQEKAFDTGVLMHSYSASAEMAKEYVKKGAVLSISGPITYQNAKRNVEVVKTVDLAHLVIETDSPYLTPVPKRGLRNEPSYVKYVCDKIAEIKGISSEEVAARTLENATKFFRIGATSALKAEERFGTV